MSGADASLGQADLKALEALQADAAELEHLKNLLDRFSIFELVGFVNDESTHSDFLAFLLDPKRNEGLGDRFIKEVLRESVPTTQKILPPLEFGGLKRVLENLDGMDFSKTVVRREHYDIDILLINEDYKLAVIIENKVRAIEGPEQLEKYNNFVRHTYPGWDLVKIFLTRHGTTPTHCEYVPLDYGTLCDRMDSILEDQGSTLACDVKVSMRHYARMVRRQHLGDPDIVELCHQIYHKHKRAIELVYRNRPDVQKQIRDFVVDLIRGEPRLTLDSDAKNRITFGVEVWDAYALLTTEQIATSERMLSFQFWNDPGVLNLNLWLGPGPPQSRQKLLEIVRANAPDVFMLPSKISDNPVLIYHRPILKPEVYDNLDREQREEEIRRHWNEFLGNDLLRIEKALNE